MRWMWIDSIVEFVADKRLSAIKNVSLAEEYLHDHFPATDAMEALPVLPASLIIEGMAQTAGILVGSTRQFRERVILAKISLARLDCEVFPGQTVRYDATLERIDSAGAATAGVVSRLGPTSLQWEPIGRIDLMFSHLDEATAGIELPQHNFVFGENLDVILRTAGLENLKRGS